MTESNGRELPLDSARSGDPAAITAFYERFGGDIVFSRVYSYSPIPIDEALVDSLVNSRAEGAANSPFPGAPTVERAADRPRHSLYLPKYHPPASALLLGRDGSIWLCAEKVGRPTVDWTPAATLNSPTSGRVKLPHL